MPVMDGYDATRAIRALEQRSPGRFGGRRLPIVALTANALVGDAETCRAAGMDDHLAKPYTRKQLANLIARWLPASAIERQPETPSPDAGPAARPAGREGMLDKAALDNIRALDDDGTVLAEVIDIYFAELPAYLQALRAAIEAADAGGISRQAHALKSASLNVGARGVGELCKRLEREAKAGSTASARDLLGAIDAALEITLPALRAELGQAA